MKQAYKEIIKLCRAIQYTGYQCKNNKILCKIALKTAGYKVYMFSTQKEFKNKECDIFRELITLLGHKNNNDEKFLKFDTDDKKDKCIKKNSCSLLLKKFLLLNNINITPEEIVKTLAEAEDERRELAIKTRRSRSRTASTIKNIRQSIFGTPTSPRLSTKKHKKQPSGLRNSLSIIIEK
jgi:hypothetical protein